MISDELLQLEEDRARHWEKCGCKIQCPRMKSKSGSKMTGTKSNEVTSVEVKEDSKPQDPEESVMGDMMGQTNDTEKDPGKKKKKKKSKKKSKNEWFTPRKKDSPDSDSDKEEMERLLRFLTPEERREVEEEIRGEGNETTITTRNIELAMSRPEERPYENGYNWGERQETKDRSKISGRQKTRAREKSNRETLKEAQRHERGDTDKEEGTNRRDIVVRGDGDTIPATPSIHEIIVVGERVIFFLKSYL